MYSAIESIKQRDVKMYN